MARLIRCLHCGKWAEPRLGLSEPLQYALCPQCRAKGARFIRRRDSDRLRWYYQVPGGGIVPCIAKAQMAVKSNDRPQQGTLFCGPQTSTDTDGWRLLAERVKMVLRRGRENAMTARAIASALGINDGQTNYELRRTLKCMLREGYPVISCEQGFFVAQDEVELQDYIQSLRVRILGLQEDIRAVEDIMRSMRMQSSVPAAGSAADQSNGDI
jgi:hypothetical protein